MTIPFLDLKAAYEDLALEIDQAVARVLRSGWYVLGEEVELFESDFAAYVGSKYCVGVANGLDAIHLGLRALGVGPGHEVIVPSNTYIATWLAVTHCGAIPVPVEPHSDTYNINEKQIEAAISPKTKAIIPVHLYGQPANLEPILEIARTHELFVLEDAAQAHGAQINRRSIGAHSDVVAWSFYPGKNLGAIGDAGAVTSNNADLAKRIANLRNYGSQIKYVNDVIGYNSRLDPIHAAVLRVKLKYLNEWNRRRSRLAQRYSDSLKQCGLTLPYVPDWAIPAWHLYVVRHQRRDLLQKKLQDDGISTLIHYPIPPFRQRAYIDQFQDKGPFPVADTIANEIISLPMYPHLKDDQQEKIITAIRSFADWQ